VRALAAEVAGYRGDAAQPLVKLLSDPSPEVRQAAHDALVKLNGGTDLGAAAEAWEKRFP
jgi:HEAT repeat protein